MEFKDFSIEELTEIVQAATGPDKIPPLQYLNEKALTEEDEFKAKLWKTLSKIKCHSMPVEK